MYTHISPPFSDILYLEFQSGDDVCLSLARHDDRIRERQSEQHRLLPHRRSRSDARGFLPDDWSRHSHAKDEDAACGRWSDIHKLLCAHAYLLPQPRGASVGAVFTQPEGQTGHVASSSQRLHAREREQSAERLVCELPVRCGVHRGDLWQVPQQRPRLVGAGAGV